MNKAMEGEDRHRQAKTGLYPPPFLGPAPHTDMQFYQVITTHTQTPAVQYSFKHYII